MYLALSNGPLRHWDDSVVPQWAHCFWFRVLVLLTFSSAANGP
jgi:hypothetical protein